MRSPYGCGSPEHQISRRSLIAGLLGGTMGTMGLSRVLHPAVIQELKAAQKRLLVFFLAGGSSQLETWDPKPGTDTGGPFQAIQTCVPGVHLCELLPYTARQMHHLALVRGVNTFENTRDDHGKGDYDMHTGHARQPGMEYPH